MICSNPILVEWKESFLIVDLSLSLVHPHLMHTNCLTEFKRSFYFLSLSLSLSSNHPLIDHAAILFQVLMVELLLSRFPSENTQSSVRVQYVVLRLPVLFFSQPAPAQVASANPIWQFDDFGDDPVSSSSPLLRSPT